MPTTMASNGRSLTSEFVMPIILTLGLANSDGTWQRGAVGRFRPWVGVVMVEQKTRERVDEFWASTLVAPIGELHADGVRVRVNPPSRAGWRGIYVIGLPASGASPAVTVFTPADHLDKVSTAVAGL